MKAIFTVYSQAYGTEIEEVLEQYGQRGYTQWQDMMGRGTQTGDPHLGNHAWPEMNFSVLTIVGDDIADDIMAALGRKNEENPGLGLRAFMWSVDKMV